MTGLGRSPRKDTSPLSQSLPPCLSTSSKSIWWRSITIQGQNTSRTSMSRPISFVRYHHIYKYRLESKRNILILLAGTSGTGKSTLSSLLGSRLGISTVISTDTIRPVMRNFVAKEDDPIIFASTYECASFVDIFLSFSINRYLKTFSRRRREHFSAIRSSATRSKLSSRRSLTTIREETNPLSSKVCT